MSLVEAGRTFSPDAEAKGFLSPKPDPVVWGASGDRIPRRRSGTVFRAVPRVASTFIERQGTGRAAAEDMILIKQRNVFERHFNFVLRFCDEVVDQYKAMFSVRSIP